jgi:hypothetical protein
MLACDDDAGGSRTSRLTAHLTVGTYYAVVKGYASSSRGNYTFTIRDVGALDLGARVTCDNDSAGSNQAQFETDLAAGDYYIVVKGASSSAMGAYTLHVYDATDTSGFVTCNDDDTAVITSRITRALAAGTYYVVVKGHSSSGGGAYTLSVRDSDFATTTAYACDYDSGPSGTSFIEQNLAAGTYRVFVKGKAVTDAGSYKLILRDVTGVPTNHLTCNGSGTGAAYLEQDLAAGTYTVVMQSNTSGSSGAYQLSVRDATQVSIASAPYCNNDATSTVTSKLTPSLTAGTYYALVKGNRTANRGLYQLNIGAKTTTTGTFAPPTWAQTQAALNANSIRVMSVLSCHDDPNYGDAAGDCVETRTQARALANATGALGSTLQPLVFDIDGDGSGLSKTVVDGIGELADYLEMNVSVRVVFEPDANPGFGLTVRAVDAPGDGCSGLLGLEHQRCIPGATPRFELAFDNPLAHPVPTNPNDPNGGYNFRAELIGDQQFIVDRVPIYIVPRDVSPPPPAPVYAASGAYWQDVSSPGCFGTQRPDWHDLTWNADLPNGAKITFGVCAGDDPKLLDTCTPTPLCTVTGGGPCVADIDCTDGYCSNAHNCHFITAGSCTSDDDCTAGASCRSGTCRFGGQPVYIGDALANTNYTSNLRMQVSLAANTSANTAPTVYDWALTYLCNSAQ